MPPPGFPKQVMPNHGTCDLAVHRTDSTVRLPHKYGKKTTHLAQSEAQALHGTCSTMSPSTRLPSGASHHPHAPPSRKDHSILRKTGFRGHAPGHETEAQLPGFTAELLRGPKARSGPEITKSRRCWLHFLWSGLVGNRLRHRRIWPPPAGRLHTPERAVQQVRQFF